MAARGVGGGGGTAAAGNPQQRQQQQGGSGGGGGGQQGHPQNKRWTGSHSFGGNNNSNSSNSNQHNARSQSPLNPLANKAASNAAPASQAGSAGNHATAASSSANITATPDELAKMHDRMLFLFANLVGHKVRCTLRTGIVYTAILSTINDADLSICLKLARQVEPPLQANGDASGSGTSLPPPKPVLVVSAKDVIDIYAENVSLDAATYSSGPGASRPTSPNATAANQAAMSNIMAALGGDTFRTDTDISGTGTSREQRELQRWGMGDVVGGGLEDGLEGPSAGGKGRGGGAWDQFAVNERLFGTKTNYQEEIYTTKLDKSGADYKAREAKAARIAEEIQSGAALNSHVAEERGGPSAVADDSGMDEEDKYSGVIRGQGAYVPPGARRALAIQTPPPAAAQAKPASAKANGAAMPAPSAVAPSENKAAPAGVQQAPTTPAPQQPVSTTVTPANKEDLVGEFKKFVTNEKEKLVQKRSQLEKQNKDKKMAELKSWSAAFVLKTPVPADLVPILAKDEVKQQEIANRKPTPSVTPSATSTALKPASTHTSPNPPQAIALKGPSVSSTQAASRPPQSVAPEKKASAWAVPTIPAFDPQRAAAARAAKAAAAAPAASEMKPVAPAAPSTKFNVAAKEFVFRPTAGSFVPGGAAPAPAPVAATPSPAPVATVASPLIRKPSETAAPPVASSSTPVQPLNPFFGTRIIRNNNNAPFRVKEDFSPFKRNEKIPDPATVQPAWGFTGKTYKAAASYSFPSTSTVSHAVSPQPSHALPPHMQQGANGRLHGVASPPLSSQASHLSRTSSSQGVSAHASSMATSGPSSEDGIGKSGIATPVPSSNTSNSGMPTPVNGQIPAMQHHQQQPHHATSGQPHMVPQGFVYQPQGQQYPTFRYMPGMHQQTPGQVQSPGGQPGHHPHMVHPQQFQQMQQQQAGHQMPGQATQFVMGPNGQPMSVLGGQFFPPGAVPTMLSPHMAGQLAHGQQYMQPVRGQAGQMVAGQPHQVFYPLQGSPSMQHHYMQMAQQGGMTMPPSQPMFEQPGQ